MEKLQPRNWEDLRGYRGEADPKEMTLTTHDKKESQGERMTRIVYELCGWDRDDAEDEKHQLSPETSTTSKTETVDTPTNTPTDLIYRQAAIEAMAPFDTNHELRDTLESLPPVEPPKKVVAQIKVDIDELIERIKEEYEITDRQVCEDAISRADTIKAMCRECTQEGYDECREDCTEVAVVKSMPPVEPTHKAICEHFYKGYCNRFDDGCFWQCQKEPEQPKGEWVSNHDGSWNCSECGLRVLVYAKGNFCPNCGADMRGDKE